MMSEELEKVRQHILDEIMEEIHIDRMFERMRREPDRIVISTNSKRYVITVEEEAQLAALKPAAEAMGVLERLVKRQGSTHVTLYHNDGLRIFGIETREDEGLCDYRGNSLIEAVLEAGGEDANPTR